MLRSVAVSVTLSDAVFRSVAMSVLHRVMLCLDQLL